MADPSDIAIGAGSATGVIGVLWTVIRLLGGRNVKHLDDTLLRLEKAIEHQAQETKQLIGELSREMRMLRDTDIRQAEQIGALQQGQKNLTDRVDGQADAWRRRFERFEGLAKETP